MLEGAAGIVNGGAGTTAHRARSTISKYPGGGKPAELDTHQAHSIDDVPAPMTPLNADVAAPVTDSRSCSVGGCQTGAGLAHSALLPPGSEPELQEAIRDSPFLDLSSPMTPYEWLKIPIMVRMHSKRAFPFQQSGYQ